MINSTFLQTKKNKNMKKVTFSFLLRLTLVMAILFRGFSSMATICPNATVITQAQLPIFGQSVVCGIGNDINSTTVASSVSFVSVSSSYIGGNEALYEFTPTSTGYYNFEYTGVSWTSITIFSGCPTTAGSTLIGGIGNTATAKSIAVSLTAGTTYYFMFDTWPTPNSACPGTFSLSLIPFNTATASAIGGLWSSPTSWASGVVPNAASSVVVPAGSTITIDQNNLSFVDLTISGTAQWISNTTTAHSVTINGNMLINSGGIYHGTGVGGASTTINLFGNFTNNGYANLSVTSVIFKSPSGCTFDGSGVFQGGADGRGHVRVMSVEGGGNHIINTSQELTLHGHT